MAAAAANPEKKKRSREEALARWWAFPRQDDALAHAAAVGEPARVWAHELSGNGSRSYIVASVPDFWAVYRTIPPASRHHYELISVDRPCRLYFDLEFNLAEPNLDSSYARRSMDAFWALLEEAIAPLGLGIDRASSVELDSSTAAKFSRHVAVCLRRGAQQAEAELLFPSNQHVGCFVRAWLCSLRCSLDARARLLFAPADPTAVAVSMAPAAEEPLVLLRSAAELPPCLIDASVYSRNRCFRLYSSAKAGKVARLLPVQLSEEQIWFLSIRAEAELFARSLVCPHLSRGAYQIEPLEFKSGHLERTAQGDAACASRQPSATPPLPQRASPAVERAPLAASNGAYRALAALQPSALETLEWLRAFAQEAWARKSDKSCQVRPALYREQPWPAWPEGGPAAGSPDGALVLVLPVAGNRWCGRLGREHRSNGIFLRAQVCMRAQPAQPGQRAVGFISQRCHDPDCRAFRGDEIEIPPPLAAALARIALTSAPLAAKPEPPVDGGGAK